MNNNDVVMELLLSNEIIASKVDEGNIVLNRPIHLASSKYGVSIVDRLNIQSADTVIRNSDNERALDMMIDLKKKGKISDRSKKFARLGTIYALLCGQAKEEYDADLDRAMSLALKLEEDEIAFELANEGYGNERDENGNTPLHLAFMNNKLKLARHLLLSGASLTTTNNEGKLALDCINSKEALKIVFELAIIKGITSSTIMSTKDEDGNTFLIKVATSQDLELEKKIELIKYMLDNGADKEERDSSGLNLKVNIEQFVFDEKDKAYLLDLVDNYIPNLEEMKRREKEYEKKLEALKEQKEDREILKEILNGKKDWNEFLSSGKRAIHFLIEQDDRYSLRELLEKGARGSDETKDGRTAFEEAVCLDRDKAFEALLQKEDWINALKVVIEKDRSSDRYYLKKVIDKLKEGRNIRLVDTLEYDPVTLAMDEDNREALCLLLEAGLKIKTVLPIINNEESLTATVRMEYFDKNKLAYKLEQIRQKSISMFNLVVNALLKTIDAEEFKRLFLTRGKSKKGEAKSFFENALLNESSEYLKGVIKLLQIFESKIENIAEINEKIEELIKNNLEKMIEHGRVESIDVLLKEYGNRVTSILVDREDDKVFGRAIYMAAGKGAKGEGNLELVETMLSNFIEHRTRRGIQYDKARDLLALAITKGGESCGVPLVGFVTGKIGEMLKTGDKTKEDYPAIRYIDRAYKRGVWALNVDWSENRDAIKKYYKEAVNNLREPDLENFQREREVLGLRKVVKRGCLSAKRAVKSKIEITDNTVTGVMLIEALKREIEEELLTEYEGLLREYNILHNKYERVVMGRKGTSKRRGRVGVEVNQESGIREAYERLIELRRKLEDLAYRYVNREHLNHVNLDTLQDEAAALNIFKNSLYEIYYKI